MAKRRLTRQQQRRIADSRKNLFTNTTEPEQDITLDEASTQNAMVVSHFGKELIAEPDEAAANGVAESETDPGRRPRFRIKCRIRQNLGDIACGDRVLIQRIINHSDTSAPDDGNGSTHVVVAIQARDNLLTKTGFGGNIKAVAANIGQIVIVTAVQPKPNPYLIDRYLAAAENLPARCVIVINKADLASENDQELADLAGLYKDIGYPVIFTSAKQEGGMQQLEQQLENTTSILVGLSGVGKSSLVKQILPEQEIRIGDTSTATGEGRHTTTVSALYHLECGGSIIDSPGVRDFTPTFSSAQEVMHGFIEIARLSGHCRFSNCSHRIEPGCALREAVDTGEISRQRYMNYLRMVDELGQA